MNVAQNVETAAKLFPEKTAILFEGKEISYSDLNVMANRLANAMQANGIKQGDRVALYLPNIPEFAFCYFATLKVGAIAVSVNPMLKAYEMKYIMNDSGAVLLFTVGELLENIARDEYENLKHVVVCEGDTQDNPTLASWMEKGADDFKTADLNPDVPAAILYTSGTTGFPKGATLTQGNVVSNSWTTVHHAGFKIDDRMPLFLPLFHVFGQNFIMNGAITACATIVMYRRFVPDVVLGSIGQDKVTMFFAVPAIYIALLNMDLSKYDLSSIRYEFSAASTMPREISSQWTEKFGRPIYEGYGLTECSPFAAYNHDFNHKFGSVGTPVENFEIKILDDKDNEVELGKWGEICVRGPGVMQGYWSRPKESAEALRGGWLHSGDTGYVDDEGYVFIVDRVKDMINVAGFKIWPAEIEQFLYTHPAIQELAVYGVPHPEKGETVKAAIVLKENASATIEEITTFCRDNLANYKVPAAMEFVAELPKSATGKILKRVLRDEAEESK
jgi:long-chain acyl-CoA synthetase